MHVRGKMPSRVRHPYRGVCVLRQRDVREVLRKVLEELGREDKGDVRLVEARADEKAFAALDVLVGRRQPLRGQLEVAERGVADALVLELEVEAALVLRGVRRAERVSTACAAASVSSAPRRGPALRLTPAGTDAGASAVRTFFRVLRHAGEVAAGAALLRVAARRHRVRAVRGHTLGGVVRLRDRPGERVVVVRRHAGVEKPAAASLRLRGENDEGSCT